MRAKQKQIAILILAAGASSRMGQPKQLLPWGETTLLGNAIHQARAVSEEIFVVLGANNDLIERTLSNDLNVLFNPDWEQGMGTSIAKGIQKISQIESYEAVLIMLSDQPLLGTNYLNQLKTRFFSSPCKIAATSYEKNHGVPALFHRLLFQELVKLNKDYGAKKLMRQYNQDLIDLNPNGKEIDIDTFETYQQLVAKLE